MDEWAWSGTSLVVQGKRLCAPKAGGPCSGPGQGTRSHMPKLKFPHALTKTWRTGLDQNTEFGSRMTIDNNSSQKLLLSSTPNNKHEIEDMLLYIYIYIYIYIYNFAYFLTVPGLPSCIGFSCCGAQALGHSGLCSHGMSVS